MLEMAGSKNRPRAVSPSKSRMLMVGIMFCAFLALPVLSLPPEGWEPPDPVTVWLPDGSGWLMADGSSFTLKKSDWQIKVSTTLGCPLTRLMPGETTNFSINILYANSLATVTGRVDSMGNPSQVQVSSNFGALMSRFTSEHPEALAYNPHSLPLGAGRCVVAVAEATLGAVGLSSCSAGVNTACVGSVTLYFHALMDITDECVFVG